MAAKKPLGKITHFYGKIGVAVVALNQKMKLGDRIKIGKDDHFFEQEVTSLQYDHKSLQEAKKGQEIGMKVEEEVKAGYVVFKA